jgi:hypothetical protein
MEIVSNLIEKYKENSYMNDKLTHYLINLPSFMQSIEEHHIKKNQQLQELTDKKEIYIKEFLANHAIFYIPQTELFIEYIDSNYTILSDDDIAHYVLSELTDNDLKIWKYKIKKNIIKRLKENLFTTSIPDVTTIKSVFQSLTMFNSKNHIKYFLTVLGDCILGKKDTFVYFIDSSYKKLIRKCTEQIYAMTNKSVIDNFKYKFWDHKYDQCRMISGKCPEIYKFPSKILNMISVATHLSTKYTNAEGFLSQCTDEKFIEKTLFLNMNTPENIITMFIDETMHKTGTTSYKDFYFLWRSYLKQKELPLIISDTNFKTLLTTLNLYKDDMLPFTSKQLYIQNVKLFLEKYPDLEDQYDISELVDIYNKSQEFKITEDMLRDIIILL